MFKKLLVVTAFSISCNAMASQSNCLPVTTPSTDATIKPAQQGNSLADHVAEMIKAAKPDWTETDRQKAIQELHEQFRRQTNAKYKPVV